MSTTPQTASPPAPGLAALLRRHLRPYRRNIAIVAILQVLQTIALLYLPTLNASIIDEGVATGDTGHILTTGAAMIAITLFQVVAAVTAVYFAARTALGMGRDIRAAVFAQVQTFSIRDLGRFGTPSLITRTTNDVEQVQMLVLMALTMMVTAPILGIGGIVLALGLNVSMSALLVVILPAMTVVVFGLVRVLGPLSATLQKRIDTVNRVVREQITGIRVVRAFVRDDHERRRFDTAGSDLMAVAIRMGRVQALMMPLIMIIMELSGLAVTWFGAHQVDAESLQVGELLAFGHYVVQILMGIMMATFAFLMAPRAKVCAERIQEVLTTTPGIAAPADAVDAPPLAGHLEVRDVSFRYHGADEPVLHGVDLLAMPGQTTAIVGATGSGKTTLINLLPRLFDPDAGSIHIDGMNLRELSPRSLVGSIGLVPQQPYLFSGTVADNLRFGKADATDAQLWQALETAQARDFVEAMPQQLNATIGQGGSNVSGGQRQRLAIARALVARPRIYLFDDSFSALDYTTDAALRAALAEQTTDAAVVIVAQRVSTIRNADRIVVLDAGRVAGTGTHAQLMADNPTYQQIVLSQLTEQEAS